MADTKHDLTADPWGFLRQALQPWTDIFPLGQLQNQAYGYLFPQGLFFAVFSWLPGWVTQRLWWGLLLALAFAGMVRLVETCGIGSRSSRVVAGVLFALSPRMLTTVGAISSEAWAVALVPWVLLPVVRATSGGHGDASGARIRWDALSSAVAVLCLGAVNAVATAAAVLPAVIWWGAAVLTRRERRRALNFGKWWIPAGILACFWWIGPLLILGKYSPPFTDYIESSSLTTRWLNLLEVLRGATSWVPFLSTERPGGHALSIEPLFIAATLVVALVGLWGLGSRRLPRRGRWIAILAVGLVVLSVATTPFSPVATAVRGWLDGPGAALRNLHKFDPLVRLPLMVGVAHALKGIRWPSLRTESGRLAWQHPERNPVVVKTFAVGLLVVVATAPGWSNRLAAADGFRHVPQYWTQAAQWLNENTQPSQGRTMILPEARFGRQTWGNTRDEPAQPLLNVPWVIRDSVPLVAPEAIRALDGVQHQVNSGAAIPSLAASLQQQGVGQIVVRHDLTTAADTPGAEQIERTLQRSQHFHREATFGGQSGVTIYSVAPPTDQAESRPGDLRTVDTDNVEVVQAGPESLPRLDAADAALGRSAPARTRILSSQLPDRPVVPNPDPQTITDTPALRNHNYGAVIGADSDIRWPGDRSRVLNPVKDYPVRDADGHPLPAAALTQVQATGGRISASSSASDPTSFGGADTTSSLTAAVDENKATAWRPTPGNPAGEFLELDLDQARSKLGLDVATQGSGARIQVTTYLGDSTMGSTTVNVNSKDPASVSVPPGKADRIRLTIVGSYGDMGISEVKLKDTSKDPDEDITPRRIPTVPAGKHGNGVPGVGTVNRWVFGQEIPEGTMQRAFTVPGETGPDGSSDDAGIPVVVHSDRCGTQAPTRVQVDGHDFGCGDTLRLTPGKHRMSSPDRWVSLTIAEPLFAAAVANAPAAQPLPAGSPTGGELPFSTRPRIVYSASSANPGRTATLTTSAPTLPGSTTARDAADTTQRAGSPTHTIELHPVTVNGWQQGWIVPAGVEGHVDVSFGPTRLYQAWLGLGGVCALVLLGGWVVTMPRRSSRSARVEHAAEPEDAVQPRDAFNVRGQGPANRRGHPRWIRRIQAAVFFGGSAVAVTAAVHGPWGSPSYAGDSWIVEIALLLAAAAAVTRRDDS